MNIAYVNNKYIPLNKAKVPILDRGFLYGDGVFETMRARGGVIFRFDRHLKRMLSSLEKFDIRPRPSRRKLERITRLLLRKSGLKDAYVKIIITRGRSMGPFAAYGKSAPTMVIYALPYKYPAGAREKGVSACVLGSGSAGKSEIPRNKSLNYLNNILCRIEARKKGFDDAIMVDSNGFITEATASNVFLVKSRTVFTSPLKCGILPGITRREVIDIVGKRFKGSIRKTLIKKSDLRAACEIFLTNSLKGIIPVVRIDNRVVGGGKPGPVTQELSALYENSVKAHSSDKK